MCVFDLHTPLGNCLMRNNIKNTNIKEKYAAYNIYHTFLKKIFPLKYNLHDNYESSKSIPCFFCIDINNNTQQ